MTDIQQHYKNAGKDMQQLQLVGTGTKIEKIYYLIVEEEERQKVQSELKDHLGLK